MFLGAVHDVSRAWDVGYYHMPFAARLGGIVPAKAYLFSADNEARFHGFPLLGELLQALLWRVTGDAAATNLLAWSSLGVFALFLKRELGVRARYAVLALLGIPLVHVHATSSYVDLPGNVALAILVLVAMDAWGAREPVSVRKLAWALGGAAVAANTKALLQPLVLLALVALSIRVVPPLVQGVRTQGRSRRTLIALVLALPVVFASPLKNAALHGNPFFPVAVHALGVDLPGPEEAYASAPDWLSQAPRPLRFAASVLEIGVRPLTDPRRWTVDQWTPPSAPGYRMGGFFGAYVLVEIVLLGWRVAKDPTRRVRAPALGFAGLTLVVSVMPQCHELRYYMAWMIVLVSVNLWLAPSPRLLAIVSSASVLAVLLVTRAGYAYPSGSTFAELVEEQVDPRVLGRVRDGDRVCVQKEPYDLLWAAPFHPPRDYVVKEAESREDCDGEAPLE